MKCKLLEFKYDTSELYCLPINTTDDCSTAVAGFHTRYNVPTYGHVLIFLSRLGTYTLYTTYMYAIVCVHTFLSRLCLPHSGHNIYNIQICYCMYTYHPLKSLSIGLQTNIYLHTAYLYATIHVLTEIYT